jgi:ribosomal protein S18 acetylase RimI-like enzyme
VSVEIKILGRGDEVVLSNVAPGVFDYDIEKHRTSEFLGDPRHHLAVAVEAEFVVGFASAVHYVHPDKAPELWINEVGVAPTHRNRGLGKKLLRALFELGRNVGCGQAWVLTDRSNPSAMRLYASVGGMAAPDDQVMFTFRLKEGDPH